MCDACKAPYLMRFIHKLHKTDLVFCGHHAKQYIYKLKQSGFQVSEDKGNG